MAKDSIEQMMALRQLLSVRTLRTLMLVVMALAWVPLTSHCNLETVFDLEFLHCDDGAVDFTSEESHGCEGSCCSVEVATYQMQRSLGVVSMRAGMLVPMAAFLDPNWWFSREAKPSPLPHPPPEENSTWQFLSRAALPPRAPSVSS